MAFSQQQLQKFHQTLLTKNFSSISYQQFFIKNFPPKVFLPRIFRQIFSTQIFH